MKTTLWFAGFSAFLFHLLLAAAVWLWAQPPVPDSTPDFNLVNEGLISDEYLSQPHEPSSCPLHHIAMSIVEVPVAYGLLWEIADPQAYQSAHPDEPPHSVRQAEFPYAERWTWGGCCYAPGYSPQKRRIYVCPECERAEKLWKAGEAQ